MFCEFRYLQNQIFTEMRFFYSAIVLCFILTSTAKAEEDLFYKQYSATLNAIKNKKIVSRSELSDLYDYYNENNTDSLYYYSKKVVETGIEKENFFYINYGKSMMISFFNHKSKTDVAIQLGEQALNYFYNVSDYEMISFIQNQLGISYIMDNNYVEARKWLWKSVKSGKQTNDFSVNCIALKNLSEACYRQGELKEALKFINEFIAIIEKTNNYIALGKAYNTMGNIYRDMEDMEKAEIYYQKSYNIAQQKKSAVYKGNALTNMAIVYYDSNPEKAKSYFFKALEVRKETKNPTFISESYLNIGHWYYGMDYMDSAYFYYKQMLDYSVENKYEQGELEAYDALGDYFETKKDYKSAFEYILKYKNLLIKSNRKKQKLLENDIQQTYELFNSEDKLMQAFRKKIIDQRLDVETKKANVVLMLFLGIIVFLIALYIYNVRKNYKNELSVISDSAEQESSQKGLINQTLIDTIENYLSDKAISQDFLPENVHVFNVATGFRINNDIILWTAKIPSFEKVIVNNIFVSHYKIENFDHFLRVISTDQYLKNLKIVYVYLKTEGKNIIASGNASYLLSPEGVFYELSGYGNELKPGNCLITKEFKDILVRDGLFEDFLSQLRLSREVSKEVFIKSFENGWQDYINKNKSGALVVTE